MLWGLCFPAQVPPTENPGVELRLIAPSKPRYHSGLLTVGVGPARTLFLPLLPVLMWLLLYILCYRILLGSLQVVLSEGCSVI